MAAAHGVRSLTPSLDEAYAYCAAIAKSHYENFTVASFLLPRSIRPSFQAVYAFCRHTDDLGDEAAGDRLALLDAWEAEVDAAYTGTPSHPIMVALQDVVRHHAIPDYLFRRLIQANRMDQGHVRFQTYADLLYYCEHSATPVGRMVLHLVGDRTDESLALADATCTALQLANFWQDVRRDHAIDRVYVPREDLDPFGVTEADFAAARATPEFKRMLAFEVDRAQSLFEQGLPLVDRMKGRLKLDIALFSKGGMRVLDAIRAIDYDVLAERPTVPTSRKLWLALTTAARLAILRRP